MFYNSHKTVKCNSCLMITGAPKTGKSLLSIYLCFQFLLEARIKWCVKKSVSQTSLGLLKFTKLFPELYSNIPINDSFGYVPLTREHLQRKVKIIDNSVVYIGEFSLVANSRMGQRTGISKDGTNFDLVNEELLLFTKLSGHEWNGKLVIDSQTISDVHYAVKRVLSNFLYIHHSINLLFHKVLFVREMIYSDDSSSVNNVDCDVEDNLKWLLVPKRKYYHKYDFRCYSILTDKLSQDINLSFPSKDLKACDIVSFVDYKSLKKGVVLNGKKEN